jgi:3-hydroxy-3-methylglutaryl CoA synthase
MKKNFPLFLLAVGLCVLPVCAQPKNKTLRGGIENPNALRSFFAALNEASAKQRLEPVRIMHFGDSHVAADVLTREIRERFQADFGAGGAGFVVPHQANANLLAQVARGIGLKDASKVVSTIEHTGNTSSASMVIALDQLIRSGELRSGDVVLLPAFAAGFTWGAGLIRVS